MSKVSVVTGLFGNFNKLHKTDIENAYVITTHKDKEIVQSCLNQGWKVFYANESHTKDLVKASKQSKKAKTLFYLKPPTDYILYVDHKWIIMQEHVDELLSIIEDYPLLFFRNHVDVYKEFYNSMCFPRYIVDMEQIKNSVRQYENNEVEMFLTGLILYNTKHPKFYAILDILNETLKNHNHAQCQISFPFALKHIEKKLIDNNINLKHKHPQSAIAGHTF